MVTARLVGTNRVVQVADAMNINGQIRSFANRCEVGNITLRSSYSVIYMFEYIILF